MRQIGHGIIVTIEKRACVALVPSGCSVGFSSGFENVPGRPFCPVRKEMFQFDALVYG